jgi:hypothetical protein
VAFDEIVKHSTKPAEAARERVSRHVASVSSTSAFERLDRPSSVMIYEP